MTKLVFKFKSRSNLNIKRVKMMIMVKSQVFILFLEYFPYLLLSFKFLSMNNYFLLEFLILNDRYATFSAQLTELFHHR